MHLVHLFQQVVHGYIRDDFVTPLPGLGFALPLGPKAGQEAVPLEGGAVLRRHQAGQAAPALSGQAMSQS